MMLFITICVLLYVIVIAACTAAIVHMFLGAKILPKAQIIRDAELRGEYPVRFFDLPFTECSFASPFGYTLCGFYFKPETASDKTVLFVHGVTSSRYGMVKYFQPFLDAGYNILAYDQRHHGTSGGADITYGHFEKHDLRAAADFAYSLFADTKKFVVYGESMGSAVTLQYLLLDNRVTCAVLDSPFSGAAKLAAFHLKALHIPFCIRVPAQFFAGLMTKISAGFFLWSICPDRSLETLTVPILFVHSSNDPLVPSSMSSTMAAHYFPARLLLIDDNLHTNAICADRSRYLGTLAEFLEHNGCR